MRLARSSEAGERKEEAELFTQNATPSFLLYFSRAKDLSEITQETFNAAP